MFLMLFVPNRSLGKCNNAGSAAFLIHLSSSFFAFLIIDCFQVFWVKKNNYPFRAGETALNLSFVIN